jgi:uncharacterized membrane protein
MVVVLVFGAVLGVVFASLSTSDFVQHLDRQVHAIHCSFVPGAAPSTDAASGCHVALMSTWSSVFRSLVWGGIPVALPGIPLFAFLAFRGVELWAVRGVKDRAAALFLFLVSLLPVATSIVFGAVAILQLDAFCKTCAGIYTSSAITFVGALGLLIASVLPDRPTAAYDPDQPAEPEGEAPEPPPASLADHPAVTFAVGTAELGAFVLIPVLLYLGLAPDHGRYVGTCGKLAAEVDESLLVPLERHPGGREAIEVFDPLCPACRGFEARLSASGLGATLDRRAMLFPLDSTCNWMVSSSLHPGACTVSEAILCAEDGAAEVIDWAFEHQEEIRAASTDDPAAAKRMVTERFPALKKCVGSASARQKLNRSLRWAVANRLPVLTPQLYVDGTKVCDEDTDLGLDFALSRLLAQGGAR